MSFLLHQLRIHFANIPLNRYLSGDLAYRDFDTLPVISALNIVLAQRPTDTGVKVGQNRYFFPTHERMDLGGGLEAWRGYFSSIRPREYLPWRFGLSTVSFFSSHFIATRKC